MKINLGYKDDDLIAQACGKLTKNTWIFKFKQIKLF